MVTSQMHKIGRKSLLVLLFDLLALAMAWCGAFWLRFNFVWPVNYNHTIFYGLAVLLPIHAFAFWVAGLYRGIWIFASLPDLKRVLKAAVGSFIAMVLYVVIFTPMPTVPRSLVFLFPLLLIAFMAGGRVSYRMWKEHRMFGALAGQGKPVIVVGAGRAAAQLMRDMSCSPDWRVVCLVDDDSSKLERELAGQRVAGSIDDIADLARELKARHVILAIPSASAELRRRVADQCARAGLQLLTIPALEDIMSGKVAVHSIRRVEIEDLLGREMVLIDTEEVGALLAGKTVVVTGAGGSIGSELCRQIAHFAPARIILLELGEYALYSIEQWFSQYLPGQKVIPLAADVKDVSRIDEIFEAFKPEVVFHAAAYKHVPLMEVGNAWQAVRNNVQGTLVVARAAQKHAAGHFVMVSTDKAVNPTNVMGATKRLAEMLCQALCVGNATTRFETVRFGNVLGSNGSVIPKFQEQIARGGPVTVTHPDITRYFMSIPEAARLVLQAGCMGEGGEIFVLDMGEPVRIVDLARNMIRLSGFKASEIRIEFSGLRPGEKLYEELLADAEQTRPTHHSKLRIARSRPVEGDFLLELDAWLNRSESLDDAAVRAALQHWVPEYQPLAGCPAEAGAGKCRCQ